MSFIFCFKLCSTFDNTVIYMWNELARLCLHSLFLRGDFCYPAFSVVRQWPGLKAAKLKINQSINHWGHTARDTSPCQPSNASPGDHPMKVPAPFPYLVISNRKHRLNPATNFVGAPLASSSPDYSLQRQPDKQDQLLGNVPHAHTAGVDVGGLCW